MDEKIPLMFIRDEPIDRDMKDLYLKIAKRFRVLLKALDLALKKAGKMASVKPESLEELEKRVRKIEVLLLLAEKKAMKSANELADGLRADILKVFRALEADLVAIEEKLEKKIGGKSLEGLKEKIEKDIRKLEGLMEKHGKRMERIEERLKELAEAYYGIFKRRLESSYLVSDKDVIKTLLRVRESVRKGKWKGLPSWAKEMRKEVLEDLGRRIIMAAEVAIVKELVKSPKTMAELLKAVPVSRYTLKKALDSLEKSRHIIRTREGRNVLYSLR